jgi:hypothetical protein
VFVWGRADNITTSIIVISLSVQLMIALVVIIIAIRHTLLLVNTALSYSAHIVNPLPSSPFLSVCFVA